MSRRRDRPPLTEREMASTSPRASKPRGSAPWCYQAAAHLKTVFETRKAADHHLRSALADVLGVRAWKVIPTDQPYGTPSALLQAELGVSAGEASAILAVFGPPGTVIGPGGAP